MYPRGGGGGGEEVSIKYSSTIIFILAKISKFDFDSKNFKFDFDSVHAARSTSCR